MECAGRALMHERALLTLDAHAACARAERWLDRADALAREAVA